MSPIPHFMHSRRQDAGEVYQYGIEMRARPLDRLKKRYADYEAQQSHPHPSNVSPCPVPPSAWKDAPPQVQTLRKQPLKNFPVLRKKAAQSTASTSAAPPSSRKPASAAAPSASASASTSTNPAVLSSISKHGHDRYATIIAPSSSSRKPEKLRFNLSLLFTEDGAEYCVQEARAKSMGLLGKRWPPPPPPTPDSPASVESTPDRHPVRRPELANTKKFYAEPTVTLATKEALADVFGMYNSPEKTLRFGAPAGSKYAPVRKVEPVTPLPSLTSFTSVRNENSVAKAKTPGQYLCHKLSMCI